MISQAGSHPPSVDVEKRVVVEELRETRDSGRRKVYRDSMVWLARRRGKRADPYPQPYQKAVAGGTNRDGIHSGACAAHNGSWRHIHDHRVVLHVNFFPSNPSITIVLVVLVLGIIVARSLETAQQLRKLWVR